MLVWVAAWGLFRLTTVLGSPWGVAAFCAAGLGVVLSGWGNSWWRRVLIAGGYPLSFAFTVLSWGAPDFPAWVWLLPLALVLLVYPLNAWRDAPLFPTPRNALRELSQYAPLPPQALVLDAGCGLGHALIGLRGAYPQAQLYGLEWSWPLRWVSALRCPWAHVQRGDIWRADWSHYQMVYLFQRPESMPRAVEKARAELREGAWLVSLEFEATELAATAHYPAHGGKPVWLYRFPFRESSGSGIGKSP